MLDKNEVTSLEQGPLFPECMEEDSNLENDPIEVGVPQNVVPLLVGTCEIADEGVTIGPQRSTCNLGKKETKEELAEQKIVQIEHIDGRNHKNQREGHRSKERHFCL